MSPHSLVNQQQVYQKFACYSSQQPSRHRVDLIVQLRGQVHQHVPPGVWHAIRGKLRYISRIVEKLDFCQNPIRESEEGTKHNRYNRCRLEYFLRSIKEHIEVKTTLDNKVSYENLDEHYTLDLVQITDLCCKLPFPFLTAFEWELFYCEELVLSIHLVIVHVLEF